MTNLPIKPRKNSDIWHRISEVDAIARQAICSLCGPVRIKRKTTKPGFYTWCCKKNLNHLSNLWARRKAKPYLKYRRKACERCGFIPEHVCQLDVHHKNGFHADHQEDNLQTLCANCHRYISMLARIAKKKRASSCLRENEAPFVARPDLAGTDRY